MLSSYKASLTFTTTLTEQTIQKNQFHSYDFWQTWGGTREEAIRKVAEFAQTDYFTNIKPLDGAQEAIQTLKQDHSLFIVTARAETMEKQTRTWLDKHFPNSFQEVVFTNHWSDECESISKGDVCDRLDATMHIEDNLDYAKECLNGKRKILLMNQPWNQTNPLPDGITRVSSWSKILNIIK